MRKSTVAGLGLMLVSFMAAAGNVEQQTKSESTALTTASELSQEASRRFNERQYELALPLLERGLSIAEREYGSGDVRLLPLLNNIIETKRMLNRASEALTLISRAIKIVRMNPQVGAQIMYMVNRTAGYVHEDVGQFEAAIGYYTSTLEFAQRTIGPESAEALDAMRSLASANRKSGRYKEALKFYLSAQRLAGHEEDTEEGAEHLANIAECYRELGEIPEGVPFLVKAIAVAEKALGPSSGVVGRLNNNLAWAYREIKAYELAVDPARKSVAVALLLEGDSCGVRETALARLDNLSSIHFLLGQIEAALHTIQQAEQVRVRPCMSNSARLASPLQ